MSDSSRVTYCTMRSIICVCVCVCVCLSVSLVYRTYESDRAAFVSLCVQCTAVVSPWEVGVVCGIDRLSSSSSSCDCHTFTRYLDEVLVDGARPHPSCQDKLQHHPDLLLASLEAILIVEQELTSDK